MTANNPLDLDLDRALARVLKEAYEDDVPDIIRHADFAANWATVKPKLHEALRDGTYSPLHAHIVEVPKSSLATRPIAVMRVQDRVIYQALMDHLAEPIDGEIAPEVYSARLVPAKNGRRRMQRGVDAWVDFQKAGRGLCDNYDHVCMLTTDITSYFEFIDVDTLVAELRGVPGTRKDHLDLLIRFLHGLRGAGINGVPQGPEVSALLGNFYLRPLDRQLRKLDVEFLRYQDDIKVFASESHELRRAVRDLTPIVRRRHLNLASSKTKILEGGAVFAHFEDANKEAINYKLEVDDETAVDDLKALFDGAIQQDPPSERDIKFSVYRLGKLNDAHAVSWILENLDGVPYLASRLVGYLSKFAPDGTEIFDSVRTFLADAKRNLSPIVEMHLVRMIAASPEIDDETYDCVWRILSDPAKESYVRQFAARAVGRHMRKTRKGDAELIKGFFDRLATDDLRRALLVAMYEAGVVDKRYLNTISQLHPDLDPTCRYLKGNPKLPSP